VTTVELKDALGSVPSYQELKMDVEQLAKMMEEMAMAPREEYGIRQPGERQAREKYGREH